MQVGEHERRHRPGRSRPARAPRRAPARSAARRRRGCPRRGGRAGSRRGGRAPSARARSAPPPRPTRRAPRRAGRRARRRRAAGRRCGSRARARRASRAAPRSRARRGSTSRRRRRPAPRSATSSPRSAETSGGSGKPRWTPPRPPVPMKPIPTARQAASVPPTVVAPTAPWTIAAARSRGPTLRASALKRPSSSSERPTRSWPSRTPIVAGTAPASRTRRSLSSPTSTPSPGGKPCATSVVSSATTGLPVGECVPDLVRDPDRILHGIEPSCATQRAAAASASSGPPTR